MKCENCKRLAKEAYKVFNWCNDDSDTYFSTENEARLYCDNMVKEEPLLDWRLYREFYCNSCEWYEEDCLESQLLGYYKGE